MSIPRTNGSRTHLGRLCNEAMDITESIWNKSASVESAISAGPVTIQSITDYYNECARTDDRLNVIYNTKGIDRKMKSELDDNQFKAPQDYLPFQAAVTDILAWCEANVPQVPPEIKASQFGTRRVDLLSMDASGLLPLVQTLQTTIDP